MERPLEIAYRLPLPGFPRARFVTDFGYRGGALTVDERLLLDVRSRAELEEGTGTWLDADTPLAVRLEPGARGRPRLVLRCRGALVAREDDLVARPAKSAWLHAFLALGASFAGFAASALYLRKASLFADEWALKMGRHMAGWHLLLTFALFPASVWGQAVGVRAVQLTSFVFFLIHAGLALANTDHAEAAIGALNALSGVCFLAATIYGNRAHRDMAPERALADGRASALAPEA